MRFGIALENFTPPGRSPSSESILQMAKTAESYGFESVWTWDHLLLGSRKVFPVLESLSTLEFIGAKTSKIKLGTSVLIMALRNPLVLAKTLSTIQILTGGRLVLGAATGWYEREFRATGVDYKKRGKIFEEEFQLVRKLLEDSDVNFRSGRIVLEHATLEPRSTVRIPMLMGGYSDAVLERVGRLSDGWISYYYRPEDFRDSFTKVIVSAQSSNRDPDKMKSVDVVPLAVANTFDEGDRLARDFTSKYMDLPNNTQCNVGSSVKGRIPECIDQVRKYESMGVQELVFIPSNYDIAQVELAGKEILPAFLK
ncbi:MAG: LLM class flavin-dependent oxidoreductase [Thaumarchaeota archaeon]|nr:LLM class flavin-dependent oxidoreductase [Nitrososphaerota archaeon]